MTSPFKIEQLGTWGTPARHQEQRRLASIGFGPTAPVIVDGRHGKVKWTNPSLGDYCIMVDHDDGTTQMCREEELATRQEQ